MMRAAAAVLLLLAAACVPKEGPMMAPFQDCLGCHQDGGEAQTWTVAGTWARGARVTVTDSNGKSFTLKGNDAGNFYTAEPVAYPITVDVNGTVMRWWDPVALVTTQHVGYGGCNVCHHAQTVTVGPNMAPGIDCLICHGPGGMAGTKFSAAGTFAPNRTVDVAGYVTTTNQVGNFYFDATPNPIDFATARPASVEGSSMEGGTTYGGCNRCHGLGGNADG